MLGKSLLPDLHQDINPPPAGRPPTHVCISLGTYAKPTVYSVYTPSASGADSVNSEFVAGYTGVYTTATANHSTVPLTQLPAADM